MPPKRARPRAAQAPVLHSDYDTDTANIVDIAATIDLPPKRTNEQLNLSVLQRHNPSIYQIVSLAPFTVVYIFSPDSQQWEKSGIEGTLFVCQLYPEESSTSSTPIERYNVTILNRKGLENFSTDLISGNDVEITEQYVILQVTAKDGTPQIVGLWIFSEPAPSSTAAARVINAQIIQELANRAEASRALAEEAAIPEEDPELIEDGDDGLYQEPQLEQTYQQASSGPLPGQQINVGSLFPQGHSEPFSQPDHSTMYQQQPSFEAGPPAQQHAQQYQYQQGPHYQQGQQSWGMPPPAQLGPAAQSAKLLSIFKS